MSSILKLLFILINIQLIKAHTYKDNKDVKQQNYNPLGALVRCNMLPLDFLDCGELKDHKGNRTAYEESGLGCVKFGGIYWHEVERGKRECTVLGDIECYGPRTFKRDGFPCIKINSNHYFLTTLLYSILLGFLGMDRFSLNQTGVAVMKLLSLGGLGLWWILDIFLLVTNNLGPDDNWNQYV